VGVACSRDVAPISGMAVCACVSDRVAPPRQAMGADDRTRARARVFAPAWACVRKLANGEWEYLDTYIRWVGAASTKTLLVLRLLLGDDVGAAGMRRSEEVEHKLC
jgi:hypothetical protein